MKQAASLKNLVGHAASRYQEKHRSHGFMQLITFDGKEWVRFGEVIANKPMSAL
jgi:hypothetical protein